MPRVDWRGIPKWEKPVPADPNTIDTTNPKEMAYWRKVLGVNGHAIAGAIRVVGNKSVKDIKKYLEEEAAYRKALQYSALTGRMPTKPGRPKPDAKKTGASSGARRARAK
jgi:hypothetical protein